jgi:hypothetical protein
MCLPRTPAKETMAVSHLFAYELTGVFPGIKKNCMQSHSLSKNIAAKKVLTGDNKNEFQRILL